MDVNLTAPPERAIAVVDDDAELGELIAQYLAQHGFQVRVFTTGEAFLACDPHTFCLVILDIGLPEMDGFMVCKRLRQTSSLPIIMLTAASDDVDRIVGLELGADDYMGKPFNPRELLARIKANLRRTHLQTQAPVLQQPMIRLHVATREVRVQDRPVDLTAAEFDLLALFHDQHGKVLSRDMISRHLKGRPALPFDRSIDTLVSRLRRKLKEASGRDWIRSIRGQGYVFST